MTTCCATQLVSAEQPGRWRIHVRRSPQAAADANGGANGLLTWNGQNNNGKNAGSGTYIADIQSGGRRGRKRLVIIR